MELGTVNRDLCRHIRVRHIVRDIHKSVCITHVRPLSRLQRYPLESIHSSSRASQLWIIITAFTKNRYTPTAERAKMTKSEEENEYCRQVKLLRYRFSWRQPKPTLIAEFFRYIKPKPLTYDEQWYTLEERELKAIGPTVDIQNTGGFNDAGVTGVSDSCKLGFHIEAFWHHTGFRGYYKLS